jgi:CheY-like chemotaxis protein
MNRETTFPIVTEGSPGSQAETALYGNGERVLYLDDEEPMVLLASRMLKRLGYQVEAHTSAVLALEDFRRRPADFDLVLTDLAMPGANGLELASAILSLRPDIPVLLATGYIDPDDLEAARRIGVREVILKPTTIDELGRIFHRVLAAQALNARGR